MKIMSYANKISFSARKFPKLAPEVILGYNFAPKQAQGDPNKNVENMHQSTSADFKNTNKNFAKLFGILALKSVSILRASRSFLFFVGEYSTALPVRESKLRM